MKKLLLLSLALSTTSTFAMKGMDSCAYGTKGCNSCVQDVERSFRKIGDDRSGRHKFPINPNGRGLDVYKNHPWRTSKDHVQSVVRIPGLGEENWVALTRNSEKLGDGGLFLVRFQGIKSNGGAWKHASVRKSDSAKEFSFFPMPSTNHPGGMQTLGTTLFIANECSAPLSCLGHVETYDVSDPKVPRRMNTMLIERQQHPRGELSSTASSVAAVKLEDGRYLMYVGGRASGVFGHFYVSDRAEIVPSTKWTYLNTFHSEDHPESKWRGWENASFVTECGTKDIFYVTMGAHDNTHLYKVVSNDEELSFKFVTGKKVDGSLGNTLRMGGGLHVTPDKKLLMYNTSRTGQRLNEFRPKK